MYSNAHLTSHSRMFGSRWVTTPLWLSRSLRPFLFNSPVYSCHSSKSLLFLLGPCHFCPLFCPSLLEMFPWYLQFSWWDLRSIPFYCFLFLCIVHLRRPSYLSLLFSETLHSVKYIFPVLPCLLLLFHPQVFVRPPQTTTLPPWISFSLEWF